VSAATFRAEASGALLPVPPRPPVGPVGSLQDAALREHAERLGRLLEAAYQVGDRDLALIWQRAMFDVVGLRRARRFGLDTSASGERFGG